MPTNINCVNIQTVAPKITNLYGIPLPTKQRAVIVNQGVSATAQFQFLNGDGNPIDISECLSGDCGAQGSQDCGQILVRIREVITVMSSDLIETTGAVADASVGLIQFDVPEKIANNPGVYRCECGLLDIDNRLVLTNQCYIWIDRGLFGISDNPQAGPPTVEEVRLYIRDNAPEENLLLSNFEFDLAEICHGAELAVRYWNESQPPICLTFNTLTYPVRLRWLQAIAGHMFLTAAHRFRRNHLPYQSAGLSVDDQNKFQQYDQIGMMLTQEYREWVKQKKVQINMEAAITSMASPYGSTAYHILNTGV